MKRLTYSLLAFSSWVTSSAQIVGSSSLTATGATTHPGQLESYYEIRPAPSRSSTTSDGASDGSGADAQVIRGGSDGTTTIASRFGPASHTLSIRSTLAFVSDVTGYSSTPHQSPSSTWNRVGETPGCSPPRSISSGTHDASTHDQYHPAPSRLTNHTSLMDSPYPTSEQDHPSPHALPSPPPRNSQANGETNNEDTEMGEADFTGQQGELQHRAIHEQHLDEVARHLEWELLDNPIEIHSSSLEVRQQQIQVYARPQGSGLLVQLQYQPNQPGTSEPMEYQYLVSGRRIAEYLAMQRDGNYNLSREEKWIVSVIFRRLRNNFRSRR